MSAELKILGSGSTGNGYILTVDGKSIIIELGMPWLTYISNVDLSNVVACLVSHRHKDHYNDKVAKRFCKAGIPIYTNLDVEANSNIPAKFSKIEGIKVGKAYMLGGGFVVQPMNLNHSVPNYGYLIRHEKLGKLVFATDTSAFPYRFKGVNHWLIECNYDPDIIIDDKLADNATRSNYNDHLSKQQCFDALKDNFCIETKSITLIHLSNENSNADEFKEELQTLLKFDNVNVAGLSKEPLTLNL